MPDLVSILIPAYNAEALVAETLQSAKNQTWPRKEIIVVDDGSPDRTFEIAKRFESGIIKVVRQENGGAPAARNKALSLAQGDYIQWLDADDLLHPEKISKQLRGAESGAESLTMLTCSWGKFFFDTTRAKFVGDSLWQDLGPIEWIVSKFTDNVWMNPAVWLVSRKLTELAGPWDNRLARSGDDDGEYVCRVVGHSNGVKFIGEAQCYYRIGMVGSLSWNMQTNAESMHSLVMSLQLSVEHLLQLEDSDRTRQAGAEYLGAFVHYFYGRDDCFYTDLREFAKNRLGFALSAPSVNWKYRPLEVLTGPRFTKQTISNWRSTKMLLRQRFESFVGPKPQFDKTNLRDSHERKK